jgi:FKBP-type peptidyl-prolyl cis-trans isomerase
LSVYQANITIIAEFDNSIKAGQPAEFLVNDAIKGWAEVLQHMKPGSKYKVFMPPELGYGEKAASPKIEPNAVLIFEIKLIEIVE